MTPESGAYCAEDRAPVQRSAEFDKPAGSIAWWEHLEAWKGYGFEQTARRIAQRGGFCYAEVTYQLGHEPTTWTSAGAGGNFDHLPDGEPQTFGQERAARAAYKVNRQRLRPHASADSAPETSR